MPENQLPHIILRDAHETSLFTSIPKKIENKSKFRSRSRQTHAEFLQEQLTRAWEDSDREFVVFHSNRNGVYLEFKGEPGYELLTQSLEDLRSKQIKLCNVRIEKEVVRNEETGEHEELDVKYATVFVAKDKRQVFFDRIEKYANKDEDTDYGRPKHADLVESISDLRKALLVESFWQDPVDLIPAQEPEWCEVWLRNVTEEIVEQFEQTLKDLGIESKPGILRFPERAVKVAYMNRSHIESLTRTSDFIAEYRKAKATAAFWTELTPREQVEWADSLIQRLRVDPQSSVSICILDTGVTQGHPLLAPILSVSDCQAFDPSWGNHDHSKHGTLVAGVAGYGDLVRLLDGNDPVVIRHILESVKILPPMGQNDRDLWGDITSQSISRAEVQANNRKRIICMAVTSDDMLDRGRPSSWSGAVDQITSGEQDGTKRLMIISAGNSNSWNIPDAYPDGQFTDSIQDPAQSWNALTIGAYTQMDTITNPDFAGYRPLAPKDGLSPFSTTSITWNDDWPIKPELVLEGGNAVVDASGDLDQCDDLCLLSTFFRPQDRLFDAFNMTSAATAQAAWFAAQIQSRYPEYWPETVRALIVHSAEWPETLKRQFAIDDSKKTDIKKLMRVCGYGVPNLERALYCAANSLTLISETQIQPFQKLSGDRARTKDMHLYDLPWPRDVLLDLPDDVQVQMRITLSYFIEPAPGELGRKNRYRYASHALRFDLNSPEEDKGQFVRRINAAARDEENGAPGTQSPDKWVMGQARDKGSIHSDIWNGTAAELAVSNLVAISPRIGWWRERHQEGKCNNSTRYSLIVSITTSDEAIDIYTPVQQQVFVPVVIGTENE